MTSSTRRLVRTDATARGLPVAGCLYDEYGHDWFERAAHGLAWFECGQCGLVTESSKPPKRVDWIFVGEMVAWLVVIVGVALNACGVSP